MKSGIQPGPNTCKANTPPTVLWLQPRMSLHLLDTVFTHLLHPLTEFGAFKKIEHVEQNAINASQLVTQTKSRNVAQSNPNLSGRFFLQLLSVSIHAMGITGQI